MKLMSITIAAAAIIVSVSLGAKAFAQDAYEAPRTQIPLIPAEAGTQHGSALREGAWARTASTQPTSGQVGYPGLPSLHSRG